MAMILNQEAVTDQHRKILVKLDRILAIQYELGSLPDKAEISKMYLNHQVKIHLMDLINDIFPELTMGKPDA